MNTTPKAITEKILELCKTLDDSQIPVYVPFTNVSGATRDGCFINVVEQVEKNGGLIQYGWAIWEHPNVLIEALFHACWIDTAGKLVDITPKQDGEKQILFLPDTKRKYEGIPIDNVRMILTKNPKLIESFRQQSELNRLRAKYNIDGENSHIPRDEFIKAGIPIPQGNFSIDMTGSQPFQRTQKVGRNDKCPCGSGLKFKRCCGK